jgi:hypothetical protein
MGITKDPRFQHIRKQNPDIKFDEVVKLYYNGYDDFGYIEWKKSINKEFMRYNISNSNRGVYQGRIYKIIEETLGINLQDMTDEQENISKMHTIYINDEIKNFFEESLRYMGTELLKKSDYKIYNVYFALNYFPQEGIFVKIGVTKRHPDVRIRELNDYNSHKWELLGFITKSEKTLEKDLHEKFKKYNVDRNGEKEWFIFNSEILYYAKENCTYFNKNLASMYL